jgi:hypothetical protein
LAQGAGYCPISQSKGIECIGIGGQQASKLRPILG